jgi:hypothetical protein
VKAIVIPRQKHAAAVAAANKEYDSEYFPALLRRDMRRAAALHNFLQMSACIEQLHRSEITDWRKWSTTVQELERSFRLDRSTSEVTRLNPDLAKYESMLRPAVEVAQAQLAEAKTAFDQDVTTARLNLQAKLAQADRVHLVGKRTVSSKRRAAKNARNRVFKRFLETGNEKQAVEELKSLVGTLGMENAS